VDGRGRAHGPRHKESAPDRAAPERRVKDIVTQIEDGSEALSLLGIGTYVWRGFFADLRLYRG